MSQVQQPTTAHDAHAVDTVHRLQPQLSQQHGHRHETSVFYELRRRLYHLYACDVNAADGGVMHAQDLAYIAHCLDERSDQGHISTYLVQLGVVELCQHICRHNSSRLDDRANAGQLVTQCLGIVADMTDGHSDACRRVLALHFHTDLFSLLTSDALDPTKVKFDEWRCFIVDCILAVLYNVVQAIVEARELYRDENAVHVLQKLRRRTNDCVSCQALILQAYVINEDEADVLVQTSADHTFHFLCRELASVVTSSAEARSRNGYSLLEVLRAISKLSVHDCNKEFIISSDVLPHYVQLLQRRHQHILDEQLIVLQTLWNLAMGDPKAIVNTRDCVAVLEDVQKLSDDDIVRRHAEGVLRCVGVTASIDSPVAAAAAAKRDMTAVGARQQAIFISYNHGSKSVVVRLREELRALGFTVWVDEEGVYGSIADDIIKGLDNAHVVLVCMSQKYYESPYCKKEVVYAAESYKKIIPLTLEPRYNPHGWLRFHTSDGLRYDFSSDDMFEQSLRKLVEMLKKCTNAQNTNDVTQGQQVSSRPTGSTSSYSASTPAAAAAAAAGGGGECHAYGKAPVNSWTCDDVTKWLVDNEMTQLHPLFAGFDGSLLLEYRSYRDSSPTVTATCVHDELQMCQLTMADVMRLNKALRQL